MQISYVQSGEGGCQGGKVCRCRHVWVNEKRQERALLVHVNEDRFADVVYLGNYAFQVERLGENDLEDFLDIDGCGGRAEYERGVHCLCKTLGLYRVVRTPALHGVARQSRTCLVISSCSSLENVAKVSNLVPIKNGMAVYGKRMSAKKDEIACSALHYLIEATSLPVPFFDRIESGFTGQVEHEQNCDRIIAH